MCLCQCAAAAWCGAETRDTGPGLSTLFSSAKWRVNADICERRRPAWPGHWQHPHHRDVGRTATRPRHAAPRSPRRRCAVLPSSLRRAAPGPVTTAVNSGGFIMSGARHGGAAPHHGLPPPPRNQFGERRQFVSGAGGGAAAAGWLRSA